MTYFDVEWKGGVIVLKPVRLYSTDLEQIRAKVKKLGISESCCGRGCQMGQSKIKSVVIDTNVLVSALLFGGVPGKLIPCGRREWFSPRLQKKS